jgi:hypothetical protein
MDPHDPYAHAILALCLAHRDQVNEATEEAGRPFMSLPISRSLITPWPGRAINVIAAARRWPQCAKRLRLDPEDADYLALEAQVHLGRQTLAGGTGRGRAGFAIGFRNTSPAPIFAPLPSSSWGGRPKPGRRSTRRLRRNPDNATTHANQGWACLEQSEPRKALEHFSRSVATRNPGNEWARAGLVEALKARNVIYGMMLRYFLWMAKLPTGVQFGVVIGGVLLNRMLEPRPPRILPSLPWFCPFASLPHARAVNLDGGPIVQPASPTQQIWAAGVDG